jgi:hypothetical protein
MDYDSLRKSVERVSQRFSVRFGVPFILDDQIQDASFGFDLKLPKELYHEPSDSHMKREFGIVAAINCAVRFSNFGLLTTICFEEQCNEDVVIGIKEDLTAEGFIYLPSDALDIEYDGAFEAFKSHDGYSTWWIRYFDYI